MAQVLAFFFTEMSDYYTVSWDAVFFSKPEFVQSWKKIICNCTEVVGSLLQLYHDTVYFFTTLLPREPPWIAMQIDIFRKSHFGHDYQGLLHYISIFFNATKLWNIPKKKNLHLKCQPEGISRKLFFIIACGSIIVGNDVAQVTPSILYRQAVFIIRRVERRSKAFPHINFQLLVLCWNVLKLLSLGLGGKEKKDMPGFEGLGYRQHIAQILQRSVV